VLIDQSLWIRTPSWLMASYLDEDIASLESQRYTLGKMLFAVVPAEQENFLLIMQAIVHPPCRILINQRLARPAQRFQRLPA
jgi:hypothetical protein